MQGEARWAIAVRVMAVLLAVLTLVAALEARAVRRARAEQQALRSERDAMKAGIAAGWTRQPIDELGQALRWLNDFYAEPSEGFGRAGGLCPDQRLDADSIATFAAGGFLAARASGLSMESSIEAMKTAILRTDAFRAVQPARALPPVGKER
jgi:hypothetical protein